MQDNNQQDFNQQDNNQQDFNQQDFNQGVYNQETYNQVSWNNQQNNYPKKDGDGFALASFIIGICSFLLGPILSILAIVFGSVSLNRGTQQSGKAKAGRIMGIISLVLWIIIIIIYAVLAVFLISKINENVNANDYVSTYDSQDYITSEDTQDTDIVEYAIGEVANVGNFNIVCMGGEEYVPAAGSYDTVQEGYGILKIGFAIQNAGNAEEYVSEYDFTCYVDGYQTDATLVFDDVDASNSLNTSLMPSTKAIGYLYYTVPESVSKVEIYYGSGYTDEGVAKFILE